MSNPSKSTDHRDQRDRYSVPTSYETAVWGNGGNLQFTTQASMGAQATDSSVLAQVITQAMDEFFNGGEWHDDAVDAIPCEFRPKGTEPTPVQLVNMVNRNLEFDPRQSIYDTSTIAKGEAVAGDFIFTEPTNTAAFFSHRFTLLDAHVVAGFTGNGMEQMWTRCWPTSRRPVVLPLWTSSLSPQALRSKKSPLRVLRHATVLKTGSTP